MSAEAVDKNDQMTAEMDRLIDVLRKELPAVLPADINADKILGRAGMYGFTLGVSRTNVIAMAVFAGFYADIVGVNVSELQKFFETVANVVKDSPYLAEMKKNYEDSNKQYHEKVAQAEMAEALGDAFVSPGNDKVH